MCFSATASFTAGSLIAPAGIYGATVAIKKRQTRWILLALVPFAFGIQQIIEGFVWRAIHRGDMISVQLWGLGFLFFSHFFWPFYMPFLSFSLENKPEKRRWLCGLLIVGILFGLTIFLPFLFMKGWYQVSILHHHITYQTVSVIPKIPAHIFYIAVILLALLGSSHRALRVLGVLYSGSILMTALIWNYVFTSLWCFFAALLSAYLVYALKKMPSGIPSQ